MGKQGTKSFARDFYISFRTFLEGSIEMHRFLFKCLYVDLRDMLNKFCFHVYAKNQKKRIFQTQIFGNMLTGICQYRLHCLEVLDTFRALVH